ncbi:conserved hypothetical protein [Halorhabdus tiamatea SARL4B]|uniref:SHOCT domain-containing protein n=1 Tax=Halorhabdus tiamatea SARL4B TaxID=1033806 RepID=S6D8U5_9EURY|nr:conserved hypothetical protein [Halorhabdus tiamatea SARL4B]
MTLLGLVDAVSVLSGGVYYGEEFVVLAMLGEAVEWVVAAVVFGVFAVAFLAATVVSVLRNTSIHRNDWLASIVERLEHEYPILRQFDVAEKVEPTTADRKQTLKQQYVDGDISDAEFEREMERLLDDGDGNEKSTANTATSIEIED